MRRSALIAAIVLVIANSAAGRVQQASGAPQGTNAFWCPMHPDVRSNTAGRCHICAMELVLIPPPTVGNYRLHVGQVLREGGAGVRALRIEVRHPTTAEPVTSFSSLHERLF